MAVLYVFEADILIWGFFHVVHARRFQRRAKESRGCIIAVEEEVPPSDIPAGPRALLMIEFADATGASRQAKAYSVSNCAEPSVGSEVAILDDQGDPGKVRLNSFENGYAFGIGMMGIAMLAFIVVECLQLAFRGLAGWLVN